MILYITSYNSNFKQYCITYGLNYIDDIIGLDFSLSAVKKRYRQSFLKEI